MPQIFKIALSGYNALTDTDPNHFSLYVDQLVDYILIKEKTYATISINAGQTATIAHNLGYVPFCLCFSEETEGVWRKLFCNAVDGVGDYFEVDDTNLYIYNTSAGTKNYSYHIFYDEIA